MLKMDRNLDKLRHDLVPDLIDEDDFWRNYFYQVEVKKAEMGQNNELGEKVSQREKENLLAKREQAPKPDEVSTGDKPEIELQSIKRSEDT